MNFEWNIWLSAVFADDATSPCSLARSYLPKKTAHELIRTFVQTYTVEIIVLINLIIKRIVIARKAGHYHVKLVRGIHSFYQVVSSGNRSQ